MYDIFMCRKCFATETSLDPTSACKSCGEKDFQLLPFSNIHQATDITRTVANKLIGCECNRGKIIGAGGRPSGDHKEGVYLCVQPKGGFGEWVKVGEPA